MPIHYFTSNEPRPALLGCKMTTNKEVVINAEVTFEFIIGHVEDEEHPQNPLPDLPADAREIIIKIPVGDGEEHLVKTSDAGADKLHGTAPADWRYRASEPEDGFREITFRPVDETFRFTPNRSYAFRVGPVVINNKAGAVTLEVIEDTKKPSDSTWDKRTRAKQIAKGDGTFYFHSLNATKSFIDRNDPATLEWQGTAGAEYTIFQDDTAHTPTEIGKWKSQPLTDTTTFRLRSKYTNMGVEEERFLSTTIKVKEPNITVNNLATKGTSQLATGGSEPADFWVTTQNLALLNPHNVLDGDEATFARSMIFLPLQGATVTVHANLPQKVDRIRIVHGPSESRFGRIVNAVVEYLPHRGSTWITHPVPLTENSPVWDNAVPQDVELIDSVRVRLTSGQITDIVMRIFDIQTSGSTVEPGLALFGANGVQIYSPCAIQGGVNVFGELDATGEAYFKSGLHSNAISSLDNSPVEFKSPAFFSEYIDMCRYPLQELDTSNPNRGPNFRFSTDGIFWAVGGSKNDNISISRPGEFRSSFWSTGNVPVPGSERFIFCLPVARGYELSFSGPTTARAFWQPFGKGSAEPL
ncbi:hypothetical protein QZH56_00490 [Streptomyces olivoreticuli]|uniref:hypothetical protein n=1 Tax=Streptomyces olivoreticuli TaxID=68246 RepID=UPI00265AA960|nr:hypothetical protein [Streptomyces olivoreticuli]WKK24208.1 hypothetical protein QZH56_00490 [Streptomyces olivoreticuli]